MPAPAWRARVTYVPADAGWWAPQVADHFAPDTDFHVLEAVGIPEEAGAWPVSRLSTGERQRLALLRSIRSRTRVLLLDEPTSGLDVDNVSRVEQVLREALDRGVAILLVTHDPAQAMRLATSRWLLRDGRLERSAA
jgi:ABC-type multidrug transport system ATPase subunit